MGCGGWPYPANCQSSYFCEESAVNGRLHMSHPSRQERKSVELTVSRRSRLVPTEVLRRARCRVESWRALRATTKLWRHAVGRIAVLRRRSESRPTLIGAARHYATEEIAGSMANLGRLGLRGTVVVRALAGATALLQFALELGDSVLVSGVVSACAKWSMNNLTYLAFIWLCWFSSEYTLLRINSISWM